MSHLIIQSNVKQDGLEFYVNGSLGPAKFEVKRDHISQIEISRIEGGSQKRYRVYGQFGGRVGFVTIIPVDKREPFVHYLNAFVEWAQIEAQLPLEAFLIR